MLDEYQQHELQTPTPLSWVRPADQPLQLLLWPRQLLAANSVLMFGQRNPMLPQQGTGGWHFCTSCSAGRGTCCCSVSTSHCRSLLCLRVQQLLKRQMTSADVADQVVH